MIAISEMSPSPLRAQHIPKAIFAPSATQRKAISVGRSLLRSSLWAQKSLPKEQGNISRAV